MLMFGLLGADFAQTRATQLAFSAVLSIFDQEPLVSRTREKFQSTGLKTGQILVMLNVRPISAPNFAPSILAHLSYVALHLF